jgi:formylmethanofuran dehydrogenase subunit E
LYTFVETDGCFADGVSVATNCWLGRRTMRLIDYGKVAATFVDTATGRAVRIWPHPAARTLASDYAPAAQNRWQAYLAAYQGMPDQVLLCARFVELTIDMKALISRNGIRVSCERCGEEVINGREVQHNDVVLCQPCAEGGYFVAHQNS